MTVAQCRLDARAGVARSGAAPVVQRDLFRPDPHMLADDEQFDVGAQGPATPYTIVPEEDTTPHFAPAKPIKHTADERVEVDPDDLTRLGQYGRADEDALRKWVLKEEKANSASRMKMGYAWGVPDEDLRDVEGNWLHKNAESAAKALLKQARSDLLIEQRQKEPLALKASDIGIASAYRPARQSDFSAWISTFNNVYGTLLNARKNVNKEGTYEYDPDYHPDPKDPKARPKRRLRPSAGDVLNDQEKGALLAHMINMKAPPGYSNHNRGLAIDFSTVQNGSTLGPSSSQKSAWKASWLYKWLTKNGAKYGWTQLVTEEWHWDFKELTDAKYQAYWCGTPQEGSGAKGPRGAAACSP